MPLTERELREYVEEVDWRLQAISDHLAATPAAPGRIRFPRGFLSTVASRTAQLPWMQDQILRRNIAYQYIFSDVLRWVNNRTDIWGVPKEMIIKYAIV